MHAPQVAEIFKEYGQEYFRNCETEVLKQLAPYKSLVIATGGGAVLRPMNWSYMHSGGVADICLPSQQQSYSTFCRQASHLLGT
jgi:shikimate kinase